MYPPAATIVFPLLGGLLMLSASPTWAARAPRQYHVLDLGPGILIDALDDDNTALGQHAGLPQFLWSFTRASTQVVERPLEPPSDPITSFANGLYRGWVVGTRRGHATLWRPDHPPKDIWSIRPPDAATPFALTRSLIVGHCTIAPHGWVSMEGPCAWPIKGGEPGPPFWLPTLGGHSGTALTVATDGFMCGESDTPSGLTHATCWWGGQAYDLTPTVTEPGGSWVAKVTRWHLAVGTTHLPGVRPGACGAQTFTWTPTGGLGIIAPLPGQQCSSVADMTDERRPLIVGESCEETPSQLECTPVRVRLDSTGHGTMEELQPLLDTPHAILRHVTAVNKHGFIAAVGYDGHGYLLIPMGGEQDDEPEDD